MLSPHQGGNVVNIVKTGDYEGKSTAEPYKITTLSLSTEDTTNLADYDEIKWQISFKPVDDEIWPEYQQDVLSEEVAGHSIVGTTATGTSSAISHMFKLPGVYHVKVVGSKSTSNGRRMKSKKELEGKVPKGKKSKKKQEVEDVFARSEVRVRYARRDVIDLSPTDWDNYVDAIWTLRLLSSKEGKERFNCPNFYNLDVFTTMHGGKFTIRKIINSSPIYFNSHTNIYDAISSPKFIPKIKDVIRITSACYKKMLITHG